mmetsp:Transcript_18469/g.50410  ORF Transcript_18469/g.50410 Transcript_18469/m.50410 type:complete len:294 (-) Transcript_18469:42-923(-)
MEPQESQGQIPTFGSTSWTGLINSETFTLESNIHRDPTRNVISTMKQSMSPHISCCIAILVAVIVAHLMGMSHAQHQYPLLRRDQTVVPARTTAVTLSSIASSIDHDTLATPQDHRRVTAEETNQALMELIYGFDNRVLTASSMSFSMMSFSMSHSFAHEDYYTPPDNKEETPNGDEGNFPNSGGGTVNEKDEQEITQQQGEMTREDGGGGASPASTTTPQESQSINSSTLPAGVVGVIVLLSIVAMFGMFVLVRQHAEVLPCVSIPLVTGEDGMMVNDAAGISSEEPFQSMV